VGIDMVLGDGTQSPQDVVVDVNPRLTTSYLGLRHAASVNLAQAMLSVLQGRHRALFFRPCRVKFDCHGQTTEE
jgi:predicted ATP-grasp superfamily ATP-dependent carboligase